MTGLINNMYSVFNRSSASLPSRRQHDLYWYAELANLPAVQLPARTTEMKVKQNSFKTILKLFCFSQNKTHWSRNVLAVLANHSL